VSVSDPAPKSSTKTLAVITVAIAFVVGMILGVLGTWGWILHHNHGRLPFMAQLRERHIVRHLDRELDLSPQQHQSVVRIIHERGLHIDAILGGMQPQIRREIDQANVEIERILTPEQKVKFGQMRMRMRSRLHKPEGSSPADSPSR
jgi:hypothetical protein